MRDRYSVYETKARLSAILRQVREGRSILVTLHGEPVAEIRPVEPAAQGLDHRIARLVERGILVRSAALAPHPTRLTKRPGALRRFLVDRE